METVIKILQSAFLVIVCKCLMGMIYSALDLLAQPDLGTVIAYVGLLVFVGGFGVFQLAVIWAKF